MREIKFRAYDKIDKRLIIDKQDFIPLIVTNKGVFKLDPCCEHNRWIEIEEDRFVLMQCTGLKDKNGVYIYEGDIVVYDDTPYNAHTSILTGAIKMENQSFKLISIKPDSLGYRKMLIGSDDFFNRKSKVIGNIYENKDLLKETK